MNNTRKAIALVLASGLSAGTLAQGGFAGDQGPYVGIGYQNLSADLLDVTLDTAMLTGGWQLNPYLSVEASYTRSFSKDSNPLIGVSDVRIRQGWIGSAVGSLPISDSISAYARVGWGWHRLSADFGDGTDKEWIDDPVFGVGLKANLSPMSEIRAEWTRLFDDSNINANGISFTYMHHLR
ncbi:MAG: porin family protein [Gammaproteobacteria bacterium]|nr:MAG: porin family protein [Gammaproteobacteria bacterium]